MKRIFCIFLCLTLLCACAVKPERVTDKELDTLREQYPYNDETGTIDGYHYESFEEALAFSKQLGRDPQAVVVFTPTGPYTSDRSKVEQIAPGLAEAEQGAGIFLPVQVQQVLWQAEDTAISEELVFAVGSQFFHESYRTGESIVEGGRYVAFLWELSEESPYFGVENLFLANKFDCLHLTENDVVLSIVSFSELDEFSGLYLSAFEKRIKELLK